MSRLLGVLAALAGLWLGAFGWFSATLPEPTPPTAGLSRTEGLVVLTGGEGRVARGLELLARGQADRLLISGVNSTTTARQIAALTGTPERLFQCCVDIGRAAGDTIGNAAEAALWMERHRFSAVRIVTSRLHMPRSRLEFRLRMPDARIESEPVDTNPSLLRRVDEFNKYLVRLTTVRAQSLFA